MAKSGDFTYTNTTAAQTKALPLYDMGEVSNYGLKGETNTKTSLINSKTDSDAREILSYFCSNIERVDTDLTIQNPSPLATGNSKKKGIQYGVNLEAVHVETDSSDASYRVDRPVKVSIRLMHEDAATITDAELMEHIGRAVSSLIKEDGTSRLGDLRASALRVTVE
jgi:hypothetical protein